MDIYLMYGYAGFLFLMSLIAFIFYGVDKRKAKKGAWRIPEAVLLNLGFFGGAIGAIVGMKAFRHKTKHWYFWLFNILGLAWQMVFPILYLLYRLGVI